MKLSGGQHRQLVEAIKDHFLPSTLEDVLSKLSSTEDKLWLSEIVLQAPGISMIEVAQKLLEWATLKNRIPELCIALKASNPSPELHKTIDNALGAAAKEGPERWQDWLEAVPPPPVAEVNPYEVLFLTMAEVGDAYDFADKARLPPYVPRAEDADLDKRLAPIGNRGGFMLVVGRPKSGKSRTTFEAMSRHCASRRLIAPRDLDSPAEIVRDYPTLAADLQIPRGGGVLWLDDLHNILSEEYLLSERAIDRTLKRLIDEHGLLVMATIWDTEYGKFRQEAGETVGLEMHRLARKLLALAEPMTVSLSDRIGAFRQDDIAQRYPRQIYGAVWFAIETRGEGLAAALIAWPKLREAFEYGSRELKAVVRAAVDLRRAGIAAPIPQATLERLFDPYLVDEGGDPRIRPRFSRTR